MPLSLSLSLTLESRQATFVECDFSANNASNAGQGGAIAISDSSVMQMMSCNLTYVIITIAGCIEELTARVSFVCSSSSNIAQLGGGLYSESDRIQSVVASLFSRNRGVLSGGAICVSRHARVAVNDSTIRYEALQLCYLLLRMTLAGRE